MEGIEKPFETPRTSRSQQHGATALAEALNSSNATLQSLDLRFNKIEDERTAAIAEALKTSNLTLQVMTDAVGELRIDCGQDPSDGRCDDHDNRPMAQR
jgi:hypothetical protein